MAHSDKVPDKALRDVAAQLGEIIGDVLPQSQLLSAMGEPSMTPPPDLGETFAVYRLDPVGVSKFQETGSDLLHLAKPTGRWHHQIVVDGRGEAFARSTAAKMDQGNASLRGLFVSPLATRIDNAIRWINENVGGDPLVRLLVAPAYQIHAFWLVYEGQPESKVFIIKAPSRFSGLKRSRLLKSRQFLKTLSTKGHLTGIS
jgi:hypothetical protein